MENFKNIKKKCFAEIKSGESFNRFFAVMEIFIRVIKGNFFKIIFQLIFVSCSSLISHIILNFNEIKQINYLPKNIK
jgi:hypothetical protein